MKSNLVLLTLVLAVLWPASLAHAGDPKAELKELVGNVRTKIAAGKKTEQDLAENFAAFDKVLAAHQGEKTDDVAQIVLMKAMLYLQVLDNEAKGVPLLKQLKQEYPETKPGLSVDRILAGLEKQRASKDIQR